MILRYEGEPKKDEDNLEKSDVWKYRKMKEVSEPDETAIELSMNE